jgi:hypothetical protein
MPASLVRALEMQRTSGLDVRAGGASFGYRHADAPIPDAYLVTRFLLGDPSPDHSALRRRK